MLCENIFCIYQNDDSCTLDDVEMDIVGQCQSCIYVSIPKAELNRLKAQTLASVEDEM